MPGVIHLPNRPLKRRLLSECISIASFEQGFVINKDGSLALGFEATLFEEESLNPEVSSPNSVPPQEIFPQAR